MRLLQRLPDNGGFSIVERVGDDIPPYAILSHTWGLDDDEVTYKDVKKGRNKSKPGYRKLEFCSEQAAKDGLEFFWVDTCCIDKTSSTELTEAINSMFKWYQKADSRWFRRGWTLQELLAPKSVHFFLQSRGWLGDKESLLQALHSTTHIPVLALQNNVLSHFSVDERMSWAEGRETKREEDVAYSLLGIFDVQMPLLYGQGQIKAFTRLRREIERSQSAPPLIKPPPPPPWIVPFSRDDQFVSRDSVNEVCRICAQPAGRASLVGLGGIGKSQIAIEYAYRVRDRSPTTRVFWVHAGTRARFEDGFRRIAEAIKMHGWGDPKVDVMRLVRSWLCDQSNGQWTMIVDNADDEAVFFDHATHSRAAGGSDQPAEPLCDYLPQSPNGSIFITSRSQIVAHKLTGTHSNIIEVKPMNEDDALSLLYKKLDFAADRDGAVGLVHALDSMPLAITQAAAFIQQRGPRMSVSKYVDEICRSDQNRGRLLKKDVGDSRRDGRASNSIIATWQISFEYIRKHMPTAARLLSLMSMFDRQGIPESLLQEQYERDESEDADLDEDIYTLSSFSLVKISADGREFEMHQLVQFSTKKWLELYGELEMWRGTYATLMDASYPVGLHENWPVCRALFPHAQAMVHGRPEDAKALEAWASVLYKVAWYLSEVGQYSKALELGSTALQVRENVLDVDHPDTLRSLSSLGLVMNKQGKYGEAERMHGKALEANRRVLGEDHPETLRSMANLAATYWKQRQWKEAKELELKVLQKRKTVLGEDHPDTLTSMANLAGTYWSQGQLREAEEIQLEVMQKRKTVLGEDHPDTLTSMAYLAATWKDQGRLIDAVSLLRECVQLRRRVLGIDHPDFASSAANLANWEKAQAGSIETEEVNGV